MKNKTLGMAAVIAGLEPEFSAWIQSVGKYFCKFDPVDAIRIRVRRIQKAARDYHREMLVTGKNIWNLN